MRHATLSELNALLIDRRQLDREGWSSRSISAAVDSRELRHVRRGWYLPHRDWAGLWPESQHRAEVLATALSAVGSGPVFSHLSAAVLWNLPLYRVRPNRVHVIAEREHHRRSTPGILRHEGELPLADITEIDGIRTTSLQRTVYDVIRTVGPEAALSVVDAAIAMAGGDPWNFDDSAAEVCREDLGRRLLLPGARGVVGARTIASLADGRAQRPLESVTRYRLHQLGFARPVLQTAVARPDDGFYWLDIAVGGARTFIECDGKEKYLDPKLRGSRSVEQVLLDEKMREDWIRGTTGWRIVRVESADMRTVDSAAAKFRAFGLFPSRGPRFS